MGETHFAAFTDKTGGVIIKVERRGLNDQLMDGQTMDFKRVDASRVCLPCTQIHEGKRYKIRRNATGCGKLSSHDADLARALKLHHTAWEIS